MEEKTHKLSQQQEVNEANPLSSQEKIHFNNASIPQIAQFQPQTKRAHIYYKIHNNLTFRIITIIFIITLLLYLLVFILPLQSKEQLFRTANQTHSVLDIQNTVIIKPIRQIQSKLPLNLPLVFQNSNGLHTIQSYLYSNNITIQNRRMFQTQRTQYLDAHRNYKSIHLAKYNIIANDKLSREAQLQNQNEWQRLQRQYSLSSVLTQLQMCIIVPTFNNVPNFRIQHNLNSIFTQNYSNYKVIITDDASTDGSLDMYVKYLQFYNIPSHQFILIHNNKSKGALQNLYKSSLKYCSKQSIVVHIDGDDQLIGRNVLKMFNWAYQTKKANVVYSNYYFYQQPTKIRKGLSTQFHYTQEQISKNQFRQVRMKFSHLRSHKNYFSFKINQKDLQDQNEEFYRYAADIAIFLPVMEMACGKVYQITEQFHYLYNGATGINDGNNKKRQKQVQNQIRSKAKYNCLQQDFD